MLGYKKVKVDDFKDFTREEWESIDRSVLLNLVNSMPRRIGDVKKTRLKVKISYIYLPYLE